MRTKVLSCLICALMIETVFIVGIPIDVGAEITDEWVVTYNGSAGGNDFGFDMVIGPNGNIYVTGYTTEQLSGMDVTTIAYDPNGNEIWTARYDGPDSLEDAASSITIDNSGNIYVTGWSKSEDNHYDYITVSYDLDGNERWVARYNGPWNYVDMAKDITTDELGNVYITGLSCGNAFREDIATIKYDSLGNLLWIARYDGPVNGKDEAYSIDMDSRGNVYVTGGSWVGVPTYEDYVTIAYDSNGNQLWVAQYSFNNYGFEWTNAIVSDTLGNIYVTGTSGTVAYDQNGNVSWAQAGFYGYDITIAPSGNIIVTGWSSGVPGTEDFITAAYDSNGNELWIKRYDGPGNGVDRAYTLSVDSMGNIYIAGGSVGLEMFWDCTVIAYDSNGNELWVARYDGFENMHVMIYAVEIDISGDIYATGVCWENRIPWDWFTIKYSQVQPNLEASIDIDPDTLNLKSKGRWITCYIDLSDVSEIDISTILLEDVIPAEWGDIQGDTLMVKFDRSEVEDMLTPGTYNLKVTGELLDGTGFEGFSDEVRVIGAT